MFKTETHQLEVVVSEIFNAGTQWRTDRSAAWKDHVFFELDKLQRRLRDQYLNTVKDRALQRYLRYHRTILAHLSNELYQFSKDKFTTERDQTDATYAVLERLEAHLDECLKYYGELFNSYEKITRYRLEQQSRAMMDVLSTFKSDHSGLTPIMQVIINGFLDLSEATELSPEHHDMAIRWKFVTMIRSYVRTPQCNAEDLFWSLYRENFNVAPLMVWYQEDLLRYLNNSSREAAGQRLAEDMKRSLVVGATSRNVIDPRRVSITEQLPGWLALVRAHYDKRTNVTDDLYHLSLNMSVAQLGHFIRLCFLTGCFHEQNISEIIRFFVAHSKRSY